MRFFRGAFTVSDAFAIVTTSMGSGWAGGFAAGAGFFGFSGTCGGMPASSSRRHFQEHQVFVLLR